MSYLLELKHINTFVFDVDGVLTDGSVTVMPNGEQLRTFLSKDGYAMQLAKNKGYNVAIITGGKSESVIHRMNLLGISDVYMGVSDKQYVLDEYCITYNIDKQNVAYMGDDMPDYFAMKDVRLACCPNNAAEEIKNISHFVSTKNGGEGCARELIQNVMKIRGDWPQTELKAKIKSI